MYTDFFKTFSDQTIWGRPGKTLDGECSVGHAGLVFANGVGSCFQTGEHITSVITGYRAGFCFRIPDVVVVQVEVNHPSRPTKLVGIPNAVLVDIVAICSREWWMYRQMPRSLAVRRTVRQVDTHSWV